MIKRGIMALTALRERMQQPLPAPAVLELDDELQPQAEHFMMLLRFIRWVATDCGSILAVGVVLVPGAIVWAAFQAGTGATAKGAVIAGIGGAIGITGYAMVRLGLRMPDSLAGIGPDIAWVLRRMTLAAIPGALLVFGTVMWTTWGLSVGRKSWDDGLLVLLFVGPTVAGPTAAIYVLLRYREAVRAICETPPHRVEDGDAVPHPPPTDAP